jgi:hypothetical protein
MDYAKFAIIFWLIATVILAIIGKKAFFKQFGIPQNQHMFLSRIWFSFLVCAAIFGGAISIGITFLIKSL